MFSLPRSARLRPLRFGVAVRQDVRRQDGSVSCPCLGSLILGRTVAPTASRSVSAETLPFGRTVLCPASLSRKSTAVSSYISDRCGSALPPGSGIFPCLPASVSVETLRFGRTVLAACLRPPRLPPRFGGSLTAPQTGRARLGISGVGPTATGARHGELISPRVSESDLLATPLTGRCVSDSPHLSCPASPRIGQSGWQVWQVRSDRCRGLGVCPRGMFAQHRHQSRISRSDSLSLDPRVLPTVTFS